MPFAGSICCTCCCTAVSRNRPKNHPAASAVAQQLHITPVRRATARAMPRAVSRTISTANVQLGQMNPGPPATFHAGRNAAAAGVLMALTLGAGVLCFAPSWLEHSHLSNRRTTCGLVLAACWVVMLVGSYVRKYATLQGTVLSRISKTDSLTGWLASLTGVQSCKPWPQTSESESLAKSGPADCQKTPRRPSYSRSSSHSSITGNSPTKEDPGQSYQSPNVLLRTRIEADPALAAASFDELCHHGTRWTWSNWPVKVSRFLMYILKSLWTLWLRLSPTPTNHVMVRPVQSRIRVGGLCVWVAGGWVEALCSFGRGAGSKLCAERLTLLLCLQLPVSNVCDDAAFSQLHNCSVSMPCFVPASCTAQVAAW